MSLFGRRQQRQELEQLKTAVNKFKELREKDQIEIGNLNRSRELLQNDIKARKINDEIQNNFASELQNLTITLSQDTAHRDLVRTNNRWRDYASATTEISARYDKTACIGTIYTDPIINARVAFIVGDDIEQKVEEGKDKRVNAKSAGWLNAFIEANNIGNDGLKDYVTETEIEGRLLWTWEWDADYKWSYKDENEKNIEMMGMPIISLRDWTDDRYEAIPDKKKKDKVIFIKFDETSEIINEKDFVYRKFGGRKNRPNDPAQKMWACLDPITHVELCLFDLRGINRLFVSPTPELAFERKEQAKEASESTWLNNMKLGKLFIHTGKFGYVQIDGSHITVLIKEWVINLQTVSMITGIPVHYFGLVELMSNRATADDLHTQIQIATSRERGKVESALNELIDKCADFYNQMTQETPINKDLISVQILEVDKSHWERVMNIFFPMAKEKLFSIRGLLELIPGIDANEEFEKLKMELEENRTDVLSLTSEEEKQIMIDAKNKKGIQDENEEDNQDEI